MQAQSLKESGERGRSFVLVFETGDEVHETLRRFADENDVQAAHFTAIGAFRQATLAYWDWESKEYQDHVVDQQVECASLAGNVSLAPDGESRKVHMHAVLGLPDGSARAGHLRKAHVRPTLELFLVESPVALRRRHDEETGLALLRP